MSSIQHVSTADFVSEVVQSEVPVLVNFHADWGGPCRMLAPALEGFAREFAGRVRIVKVNVDEEPELAAHFRVQSIPTLMAFRDGRCVDTLTGIGSPGQLRHVLAYVAGQGVRPMLQVR
jgi:thioredoxin 1